MASGRRICSIPSSPLISVGNCEVVVQAKSFTSVSDGDGVQISISKTAKIRVSVIGKADEGDGVRGGGPEKRGNFYFVLANPKDSVEETKTLLQEVLTLYMKELPAMKFAANTGKESTFLTRCVRNGKFSTLVLKSNDDRHPGEVIAAITYQIIPADTQYAEVPLAAVSSICQHKLSFGLEFTSIGLTSGNWPLGIHGTEKRLQSVGVRTILCWGDRESEGFWLKQGFSVIGEVSKNGRARKLPIKADVRKALCFPGCSTLMASQLLKDSSSEPVELLNLCLPRKDSQLNFMNQDLMHISKSNEPSKENNQIVQGGCSESEKLRTEAFSVDGCQDLSLLPVVTRCSVANALGLQEGGSEDDEANCSILVQGIKRRMWETSCTSLKTKKVKGTHSNDCESGSGLCNRAVDPKSNSPQERSELRTGNITNEENGSPEIPNTAEEHRIILMNIADEVKRSCLTKIIEDLGGAVSSDGRESTHVVTGKVRRTLNFCTALCTGAWVISPGWLKESFKKGRFVDEMPFLLNDEDYKTKYRMDLKTAVVRARARPGTLLKGLDIWLANHVQPPIDTLSAIVQSAGGNVILTKNELKDASATIYVA